MSLLLALTGAFLCALVTLALATALRYFGLPASVLPYNLVVLVLVYALRQRHYPAGLHPSPAPGMLPETAGRFVVLNASRFPHLQLPALDLPFKDECVITQGINGSMTHRAPWNWALDFEVFSYDQRCVRTGTALEDYHTFNKLVLAPCSGTVAAVKAHVPDNIPGANNPEENWGNYVVIYSDAGYYVLLAHLRQGSPLVYAGQRIVSGEPVGHCGNSGRSPVPHLHLQIQDTAYPGGPTRPFCLRNMIQLNPAGPLLHNYLTLGDSDGRDPAGASRSLAGPPRAFLQLAAGRISLSGLARQPRRARGNPPARFRRDGPVSPSLPPLFRATHRVSFPECFLYRRLRRSP